MYSRIALILCFALLGYASLQYYPRWKQGGTEAVIGWDVAGYYWYLPSIFIYKDIEHQSFKDSILNKYGPTPDFQEGYVDKESGNYVMKYASGVAVTILPAFFIAHSVAEVKDGFSRPYQLAIQIEWLIIAIIGLLLISRFLSYYFKDKVVALTLIFLVFGSNYLNWAAIDVGQTHSLLFTLYAALLLQTRAFYIRPTRLRGFLIGLTIGYMMQIRPTEILSVLIPLLWRIERLSNQDFKQRFLFILQQRWAVILAILGGFIGVFPQLAYWKYVTGRWLVYSYQDQGFSFLHPHLKDYTFDWAHGWLIHSPGMVLAIIGIIPFVKRGPNRLAILSFAIINYYIVASWDVWTYGSRAMIQSYPILCIFIASFITWAYEDNWSKALALGIVCLFIYYNCWWTYASHPGQLYPGAAKQQLCLLQGEEMTGRYYVRIAGTWHTPPADIAKLNDVKRMFKGQPHNATLIYSSDSVLEVDSLHENSKELSFPLNTAGRQWIRITGKYSTPNKEWNHWRARRVFFAQYRKGEKIDEQGLRIDRYIDNGGSAVLYFDVVLQKPYADRLTLRLWNAGSPIPMQMDSVRIISFTE